MLIKFFAKGQGCGAGPVDYLLAEEVLDYDENRNVKRDADGHAMLKIRDPLPEVVAGNPEITKQLIDSSTSKWSYRAGVIAFAGDDNPSEEQLREVMNELERLSFAGLEGNQFDVLWVKHVHEGNVELHFCTPRMELTTCKSLNIAPPGYQKTFDTLRGHLNKEHHWADLMDKSHAQLKSSTIESADRVEAREDIHKWLDDQILLGTITDSPSMIKAFEEVGFKFSRQGHDKKTGKPFLSVKDPETDQNYKLKGVIFHAEWKAEQLEAAFESESGTRNGTKQRLERTIVQRSKYNCSRYVIIEGTEFDDNEPLRKSDETPSGEVIKRDRGDEQFNTGMESGYHQDIERHLDGGNDANADYLSSDDQTGIATGNRSQSASEFSLADGIWSGGDAQDPWRWLPWRSDRFAKKRNPSTMSRDDARRNDLPRNTGGEIDDRISNTTRERIAGLGREIA